LYPFKPVALGAIVGNVTTANHGVFNSVCMAKARNSLGLAATTIAEDACDRGLHRDCSPASFAKSREERKIEVHNPRKNAGRGRVKTHMSSRVSHDGVAALVTSEAKLR
jgi:hypothetical protein